MRHGLDPDGRYRLVAIAPRPEADPIPERPGIGDEELEVLAGRIGHLLGSTAPGAEGVGAGIRLPAVLPLHGRIAVLAPSRLGGARARPDRARLDPRWPRGAGRSGSQAGQGRGAGRSAGLGGGRVGRRRRRRGAGGDVRRHRRRHPHRAAARPPWLDRGPGAARRRAAAAGGPGRSPTPPCERELGPLLADERMGAELVETLQAYFDAGENMREAARRLHLATRTVAYRLEKIEGLLGEPINAETRRRLSVALMVQRLRDTSA